MTAANIIFCFVLCVLAVTAQNYDAPCVIDGDTYASGERTPDPCNRCWCSNGHNVCNRRGCPQAHARASCVVNGVNYANGQRTPDPCSRCRCSNGHNVCNRRGCPQAEGGQQ
ncbi:hypothetical protein Btru_069658 [Bulinus truncatus]|nr:hypothetical protein Btru_069658 [Bulinus truncatus]